MPASTRSKPKQATLEDVGAGGKDAKSTKSSAKASTAGKKRKADDSPKDVYRRGAKPAKKLLTSEAGDDDGDIIIINRAPVLELWASCVAQFIYPAVAWETCLSVGGGVSTITAISKGRSIGAINKPDPGEAQAKREKRKEQAEKEELDEIEVMSFNVRLQDGQAMVGDKPKKAGEEALRKKFGGAEQYDKVREAFKDALKTWRGKENELDKRAFHMYEDFRPSVKPGQAGWGRKGQLRLHTIREVPEHSDPVNTTTTLDFHHDEVEFADGLRARVLRHALKTREQWKFELVGEDNEEDDEMGEKGEPCEDTETDGDDNMLDSSD